MSMGLFGKLMAAFALVILIGVGGALLVAGFSTEAEFRRYAHGEGQNVDQNAGQGRRWEESAKELAAYYAAHGGWAGVETLLADERGRGQGSGGPRFALADPEGRIVAARTPSGVGLVLDADVLTEGLPIVVDGERVGTLLVIGGEELTEAQQTFLNRVRQALLTSGAVALVVALFIGAFLVQGVTRPLRDLVAASQAIASGALETRVPIRTYDEVGQLTVAFNQMAADLDRAEEARRQQAADIAHELRTPLTVIQGHLEALADGIFSADRENLAPILEQAQLLARLVEDLRTLSLADADRLTLTPVPTDVDAWISQVVAGFEMVAADRGIALAVDVDEHLPPVMMDRGRMAQVLGNLLDNALRYTSAGRVTVGAERGDETVVFSVTDSGPGVSPEHLPHMFERFWRGEDSRSRRTGGSGMGLTIAQRVVEAHGGRIWAENVLAGGLRVCFTVPLA